VNHVPLLPQTAPTWRDTLAPEAAPRPRNRTGRRRLLLVSFRRVLGAGLAAACLIFGYIAWFTWNENPAALAAPAPSAPLREIEVRGDGVLGRAWVEHTLGVRPGADVPLMSLDLDALRARLLESGQVRVAVVARRFPDVLAVTLEERSPVLRVRAQAADGVERHLFVARDGFVFAGEGYDDSVIIGLPWLAGITLARNLSGHGFAPVPGLDAVSDLLGTARASAPALARDFQVVSLARYARDGVILVRTPEVGEIAFGTRDDFYRQIARLDYILDETRAKPGAAPIRSINLAVGGRQVPVSFEPPPEPPPAAPARGRLARPAPPAPSAPAPAALTFFRL
jgi:POTRA domain, FtsQ-type